MDSILDQQQKECKSPENTHKIPFWRVALSVLQASFGVQSEDNRERDFTSGNFMPFVVAAVLFTVAFVISLIFVVNLVLDSSSAG